MCPEHQQVSGRVESTEDRSGSSVRVFLRGQLSEEPVPGTWNASRKSEAVEQRNKGFRHFPQFPLVPDNRNSFPFHIRNPRIALGLPLVVSD